MNAIPKTADKSRLFVKVMQAESLIWDIKTAVLDCGIQPHPDDLRALQGMAQDIDTILRSGQ